MKTIVIVMLACVVSPAVADVYRCTSGHKTTYQDVPCANAKVIDNINGLPPPPAEQRKAFDRAAKEQTLVTRLRHEREVEEQMASRRQVVTVTPVAPVSPSYRPANTSGRPDRYYDRPDRYYNRRTETYTYSR
jgi:hypothetical protein